MQGSRQPGILMALTAAAFVALSSSNGLAAGTPSPTTSDGRHWMPDVAERIASLRERSERADARARARSAGDARSEQWWRAVAMAPPPEPRR